MPRMYFYSLSAATTITTVVAKEAAAVAVVHVLIVAEAAAALIELYRGADKSLARPTSRCILFDGYNISFDASLVIYIYIYIYI